MTKHDSHLPAQVREANKKADEAMRRQQQPAGEPPQEAAAAQQQEAMPQDQQPQAQPPAGETAPEKKPDNWEQKFRTLQGKYDSEVPALHKQLAAMRDEIETLKTQGQQQAEEQQEEVEDPYKQLREEYPEDIVDALANLRAENRELREQLTGFREDTVRSEQQIFMDRLTTAIPDWQQVDADPGFNAWLDTKPHPRASETYRNMLSNAGRSRDIAGITDLVNEWRQQSKGSAATGDAAPPPNTPPVIPNTSGGEAGPASDSPTFTVAQIEEAYRDAALGRIKPEDMAALENQFRVAQESGRIIR
jgi:hypothetical protein